MKGKHAQKARNRQDANERLAAASKKIERLTEEARRRRELEDQVMFLRAELERVRVQLADAMTPELTAARQRIERQKATIKEVQTQIASIQKSWERLLEWVLPLLQRDPTLEGDNWDRLMQVIEQTSDVIVINEDSLGDLPPNLARFLKERRLGSGAGKRANARSV